MNPTCRVKYSEQRKVDGVEVTIKCLEDMNYSGEWESAGYDILVSDKKIGWFWGWPANTDIKSILDNN